MIKNIHEFRKTVKRRRRMASLLVFLVTATVLLTGMTPIENESSASITVDGRTVTVRASGEPLSSVLRREGIILGEFDELSCSENDRVCAGMEVVINRVEYIERTTSEEIPFGTVYVENTLEQIGTARLMTCGKSGRLDTTVTEKLVNGEVTEHRVTGVERFEPVNEEIMIGTALSEPYSRRQGDFRLENGVPAEYAYCLSGKVTAYTAPEGSGTYSGRPLEIGTIGVDPNVIPFGSEVYIASKDGKHVYGYAIAADTGYITDIIADVYMGTTRDNFADACDWGAQDAYVYVLSVGDNSVLWQ